MFYAKKNKKKSIIIYRKKIEFNNKNKLINAILLRERCINYSQK